MKCFSRAVRLLPAVTAAVLFCACGGNKSGGNSQGGNEPVPTPYAAEAHADETAIPPDETPEPREEPQEELNEEKGEAKIMARYEAMADWAVKKLIENYWNDRFKKFNNQYPYNEEDPGGLNYWWKAHAVDAMVDAYERTLDDYYMDMAKLGVRITFSNNGGALINFIDDMEWMALACLRIYDSTQDEEFLEYANKLWKDIKTAWHDDDIGGLGWERSQLEARNACSNGPGALVAARMYQRFEKPSDLEWAEKIYAFVKNNLMDPETGLIWDGLKVRGDGSLDINKDWVFTYNSGTFIGAAAELYRITGDETYLRDAELATKGAIERFTRYSTQIFKGEGQSDGGLFKGILLRYWGTLYEINRDAGLRDLIYANAESLRYKASTDKGLFGPDWGEPYPTPLDLTCELSGCFLFETAAKIERMDGGVK